MINPRDETSRMRLSRSLDYTYTELQRWNRMRSTTVQAYLGITPESMKDVWNHKNYKRNLPQGNLLQLSGLSHQIALAYGDPKVKVTARTPEHKGLSATLGPALNRMAELLDLGETHRQVAADSYFGYGVYKVGVGYMPPAAQVATGLEIGPCVWRVGQPNFFYDLAPTWGACRYIGDIYPMDLDDAQRRFPEHADRLSAYTASDRMDAPTVMARPTNLYSPENTLWLADIYFPQARCVCTWPVRASSFGTVSEEPLQERDYDGHWSGIYHVLTHLYSPDELIPIAQAESVKSMHFLFNDILHLTSEQARNAKVNPVFPMSGDRDMRRLWEAKDRHPVSMTSGASIPQLFEIPGPSQSQTAYMSAMYQFFKELTPTLDEPQRAPTATQGQLWRQATNAIVAEARRKDIRVLSMVYRALGHLLLNDQEIRLPGSRPLRPGSTIMVDATFEPGPRTGKIDDVDVQIEPLSTVFRSPEERLGFLTQASGQISQAMMLAAQGAPINVEKVIDTYAELGNEPILREWYEPQDPIQQLRGRQSERNPPRPGAGHYVRENVSERSNAGALIQNLSQVGEDSGQAPRVE